MAQRCDVCGKSPSMGNQVETRGKAKYLGGVGTKVTGISRRKFRPNLQRIRVTTPEGGTRVARVCTQCIRSGAVRKVVRQRPFALGTSKGASGNKAGAGKAAAKS
jgi:large subunit ribosomal protein L28